MRFLSMIKSAESLHGELPPAPLMEAVGKLAEEATKAGAMVDMGGLMPSAMGARLRVTRGKLVMTDGPFSETKEVIGGYAIFSVNSKQEAIAWGERLLALHQKHWPGWEGEVELRQLAEFPECSPPR